VLRQRGLRVYGSGQDLTIQPKLMVTGEVTETYDVILVSVKAAALDRAIEDSRRRWGRTR